MRSRLGRSRYVTQFLRNYKNPLIDLKQHLKRYVKTLPVFGFNSGRYGMMNLIKSYNIDYEKLKKSGIDEQQALKKLQIRTVSPSGLDTCNYLQEAWQKNGMTVFKVFFSGTTTKVLSQPRKHCKK